MKSTMEYIDHLSTPLGGVLLAGREGVLTGLWFEGQKYCGRTLSHPFAEKRIPVFERTALWLDLYFAGKEPDFTLPLSPAGTPFQREVWEILQTIPYGKTMTYGEIAQLLADKRGLPSMSAQAVGGTVSKNPISIVIPCHRVLGRNGNLTGYAGGIGRKEALLALEQGAF